MEMAVFDSEILSIRRGIVKPVDGARLGKGRGGLFPL